MKALDKVEYSLEQAVFRSRWLLAPFYVGLILGIGLLLFKFFQELLALVVDVYAMSSSDVVVGILTLVDMSLVASLLLMIIFSGYEIFVSKIDVSNDEDRPEWMGKVDFSGLKLKLISAIVAISAIELLKALVAVSKHPETFDESLMIWQVIIHTTFVVSGVLFALTDWISSKKQSA